MHGTETKKHTIEKTVLQRMVQVFLEENEPTCKLVEKYFILRNQGHVSQCSCTAVDYCSDLKEIEDSRVRR